LHHYTTINNNYFSRLFKIYLNSSGSYNITNVTPYWTHQKQQGRKTAGDWL